MTAKPFDECYFVNYDNYNDLCLYEVGIHKCESGYSYGPIVRNMYIMHYVIHGEGTLILNGNSFPIHANQAFLIPKGELGYYEADKENPWYYIWIQLDGKKVDELFQKTGMSTQTPVYTPKAQQQEIKECLMNILNYEKKEFFCLGNLYLLFQLLVDNHSVSALNSSHSKPDTKKYVDAIIHFIEQKYAEPIHVSELATQFGLSRFYLTRIFQQHTGISPKEYLIQYRIQKAQTLLHTTKLSVQHIAFSVGYQDPFAFSRAFKKRTGLAPSEYRNQELIHNPIE